MEHLVFLGAAGLFIIVMTLLGVRSGRMARARFKEKMRASFGQLPDRAYDRDRSLHIPKYFEKHRPAVCIDDITWHDLDMDAVFRRVNYCRSAAGEEVLYHVLRTPGETDHVRLEAQAAFFAREEAVRTDAQVLFEEMKQTTKYAVYDHLDMLGERRGNFRHILMLVLLVLAIVMTVISFQPFFLMLIAILAFNVMTYYREKGELNAYLETFSYVLRLIAGAEELEKHLSDRRFEGLFDAECEAMRTHTRAMRSFRKGSYLVMTPAISTGNPLDVIFDYFRVLTHADLIKFNSMVAQLHAHKEDVDRLVYLTGITEVPLSVACYRESVRDAYCRPRFTEGKAFSLTEAYHPLVEAPVANTIACEKNVLITGSNASGKSTFLKTAAICAILAETIHTVPAKAYEAPHYRIFSSMALADDLGGGDSYYIVEIKSLKRILDATKEAGPRVLCFIDEVLRGTNTLERIAASSQILKQFARADVQCFAATHDGELTEILGGLYDNYHFDGEIVDDDVRFDYRIRPGNAKTRNAIRLLRMIGYDDAIVTEAEAMAERFLATGAWGLS